MISDLQFLIDLPPAMLTNKFVCIFYFKLEIRKKSVRLGEFILPGRPGIVEVAY